MRVGGGDTGGEVDKQHRFCERFPCSSGVMTVSVDGARHVIINIRRIAIPPLFYGQQGFKSPRTSGLTEIFAAGSLT